LKPQRTVSRTERNCWKFIEAQLAQDACEAADSAQGRWGGQRQFVCIDTWRAA